MRLVAVHLRPTGADVLVLDDAGAEHRLWKSGHVEGDVPDSWWRPLVEARVAAQEAEEAKTASEQAEVAAGWDSEAAWIGVAKAAFAVRGNPAIEEAFRSFLRVARDEEVV